LDSGKVSDYDVSIDAVMRAQTARRPILRLALSCPIGMVGFQPLERRVQISGPDGLDDITDRVVTDLLDHLLAVILDLRVLLDKPM
jgi:hypothetical protein